LIKHQIPGIERLDRWFIDGFWILAAPADTCKVKTGRFALKIVRFEVGIYRFDLKIVRFEVKINRFEVKPDRKG